MGIPSDGGDYTEGEVLWLLSLTVEEARYLGEDSSLRWWDVHSAHRELKLHISSTVLYGGGYSQQEIADEAGVSQRAVSGRVHRTVRTITEHLNGDVLKAA
jgi:hypothetical protein